MRRPPASRCGFNPRPREGGDPIPRSNASARTRFNPRPREGGDPLATSGRSPAAGRFNPRPREGGDDRLGRRRRPRGVSIHAPAKGATAPAHRGDCGVMRFQSTPPRRGRPPRPAGRQCRARGFNPRPREGGDHGLGLKGKRRGCFNPRPREGGDIQLDVVPVQFPVSIHAPAKGATPRSGRWFPPRIGFQSTPPRRGRPDPFMPDDKPKVFQSTPPRRGRRVAARRTPPASSSFNPRPREGGDARVAKTRYDYIPFQSTPPRRGRRTPTRVPRPLQRVSIHAPAKGATPRDGAEADSLNVSIHAPAKGATSTPGVQSPGVFWFQSTPPRRGRPPHGGTAHPSSCFNPRPREGGDADRCRRSSGVFLFQSTPPRRGRLRRRFL